MPRIDVEQLSQELNKVKTWLETQKSSFENAQKSVEKFQMETLSSFQGETGDSVRAYAKEVYQPIHMEMMKVEAELRPVLDTITNDGKDRFGENGIVDSDYIQEWNVRFDKHAHQLVDLTHEVNRDLRSVADIIHLELLKTDGLEEIHYNTKRHCQRTIEQIDEFDRETNAKIQPIQASILRLQNMVQEVISKAPSMSGYQSGSFKFSMLSAMKQYSEEDKKQFVENMKTQYGFDDRTSEAMWRLWQKLDGSGYVYSEIEKGRLFNKIMGDIIYGSTKYVPENGLSGLIPDKIKWDMISGPLEGLLGASYDAKSYMDLLGLDDSDIKTITFGVKMQYYISSGFSEKQITDIINDDTSLREQYEGYRKMCFTDFGYYKSDISHTVKDFQANMQGKNDFAHQSITTASILYGKQGRAFGNDFILNRKTFGYNDESAGWGGDITRVAGAISMGNDDYKSDLDAVNITQRMSNGESYMQAMLGYYKDLGENKEVRVDEFLKYYGNGNEANGLSRVEKIINDINEKTGNVTEDDKIKQHQFLDALRQKKGELSQ